MIARLIAVSPRPRPGPRTRVLEPTTGHLGCRTDPRLDRRFLLDGIRQHTCGRVGKRPSGDPRRAWRSRLFGGLKPGPATALWALLRHLFEGPERQHS